MQCHAVCDLYRGMKLTHSILSWTPTGGSQNCKAVIKWTYIQATQIMLQQHCNPLQKGWNIVGLYKHSHGLSQHYSNFFYLGCNESSTIIATQIGSVSYKLVCSMHDDITICTPLAVVQKESSASRMPKVTKTNNQTNKQTTNCKN